MKLFERLETRALFSAGAVDLAFGENGQAVTTQTIPDTIAVANGGKVIVCGSFNNSSGTSTLSEYDAKGKIVRNFGVNGTAAFPWYFSFVTPESNGDVLAVGYNFIARLTRTGKLDNRFGDGGIVTMPAKTSTEKVKVARNGKIIVAASYSLAVDGYGYVDDIPATPIFLRYDASGRVDPSFGKDGMVLSDFGPYFRVSDFRIVEGQKIEAIAAYSGEPYAPPRTTILARYNADGSLDSTFHNAGELVIANGNGGVFETNGSIVTEQGENLPMITHYTANGALDTNFGVGGTAAIALPDPSKFASNHFFNFRIEVEPGGKLLAIGDALVGSSTTPNTTLIGLERNGQLDKTFGNHGIVVESRMTNGVEQSIIDGKLVLVLDYLGSVDAYHIR